jgi:hypothetical protein
MPTAATTNNGGTQQSTKGRGGNATVAPSVPFIRASSEHREPAGIDTSRLITAADQDLGVFDIPAYGYVRSLIILVTATGGAGTSVTASEDSPFNALKNIALTEPNGAVIAQFNSGHDAFLADKWGGYRDSVGSDFRASPTFSPVASATGNFSFMLRIPVEINLRDALGSLPNQNAAAVFKLRLTQSSGAANAGAYGATVPTTQPSLRIRVYLEAWDQPESQTAGAMNQVTPPAMNTTQFWSSQQYNVNSGQQTVRLTRVGNYIRNLIMIFRATSGTTPRVTNDTLMPDPTTLYLDTRPLDIIERNNWTHQMYERTGFGGALAATVPGKDVARGLDSGVWVYDFMHEFDGTLGMENRDLWLPTLGSTRLELQGNFGGAGVLTVLTNDVAIAGSVFI